MTNVRLAVFFLLALPACPATPRPDVLTPDATADTAQDAAPAMDIAPPDAPPVTPAEPPRVPVGADAYRRWDLWPQIRIGVRAYMRSTYDRTGGNETGDASHFLRQDSDDRNVTLDVAGNGVLYFVRTNHWHGSPWHYITDGRDTVVRESSTADPDHPVADSVFLPSDVFPAGLTWTWSQTRGADLSWVPIAFERSFTLAYERTFYGTGYYIYHLFPDGAENASQPLRAWDGTSAPPADLAGLLARAGEDIAPPASRADVRTYTGALELTAATTVPVLDANDGPATVRALTFTVPRASAEAFGRARLRVTWDRRAAPSIDAPVALFFGTGTLYNRDAREYLVRALPVSVRFQPGDVTLAVYLPMPFFRAAHIELVGAEAPVPNVRWQVRTQPYTGPRNHVGYLHATYVDHGVPTAGRDLELLDTTQTEGGGDWCGSFVGTSFIFSDRTALSTLEGDPRFFFDDSASPQAYGTGTEEWGGGGDYWGGQTMTLPLAGHPVGAWPPGSERGPADGIESAYRFLLADLMPFGRNARIHLEHGGENDSVEHYRTVAYWYGLPSACLVPTDALHVGDTDDEVAHGYNSPVASPPEALTSRFELGVDHAMATEYFPPLTDTGRHTGGTSQFTLRVDPHNVGVLLRRRLDYGLPDQRATVEVADATEGAPWLPAGTWYLAGSNTCVHSYPSTETGAAQHTAQTSNRRFREDEFLLPRRLTAGRATIRVRVTNLPGTTQLFPGAPEVARAWSEFRYTAYSYVMPAAP